MDHHFKANDPEPQQFGLLLLTYATMPHAERAQT
jgi:hypothetical protein